MTRVGRRARAAVAAAAATLLAAGCATVGGWPGPEPATVVVIGADVDLTGPGPGVAYGNALRLAAAQVNDQQLGGAWRLELRVLDNRGEAATSAQNLATLAGDPQVAAIVTAGCPRCVIDAAGSLTVPVIALAGEDVVAAPAADRKWVFRLGPNAADNADALSLAMRRAGVRTVGVISAADLYGREGLRWVGQAADRDGLDIVGAAELPPGADSAAVAKAAAAAVGWRPSPGRLAQHGAGTAGPDAVLLWLHAPQASQIAAALRGAGYTGALYADMIAADELFLPSRASALDGATLLATTTAVANQRVASSPAAAARQEWVLTYVARYDTYHLHSTWAADAVLVIASAITRAGSTDRAAVRTRIESTRIDGITGPIRFTGEQHSGLVAGALVTLTAIGDRWQ